MATIDGTSGNDTLAGDTTLPGTNNDSIRGRDGNDSLSGLTLNDTLLGDDGNDRLFGGSGDDSLFGGGDSDFLEGGAGADLLRGSNPGGGGNTGRDSVSYANSGAAVAVTVTGGGLGGDAQGDILENIEDLIGSAFNDSLTGDGDGNIIDGGLGNDLIYGAGGTDTLFGGFGNDTLFGGTGSESLFGGDGFDFADYSTITTGFTANLAAGTPTVNAEGTDTLSSIEGIFGGSGSDTMIGDSNANWFVGNGGNDSLDGGGGNDTLDGGSGTDALFGGEGSDSLSGGIGNDTLSGGSGDDTLAGGAGADNINGGPGQDYVDYSASGAAVYVHLDTTSIFGGDAGNATLGGRDTLSGIDGIIGSAFNDTLIGFDGQGTSGDVYTNIFFGGGGNDTLDGRAGNDQLYGGDNDDSIEGGTGSDLVSGDGGNDSVFGGIGSDTVLGGGGRDLLFGGADNDTLDGGVENDTLVGDVGDDQLTGDTGDDSLVGGIGNDNMGGGDGNDTLDGGSGRDTLAGGVGDDSLAGQDGEDFLGGGEGNDRLLGGIGNDTLFGGADSDSLSGEAGNDSLSGDGGSDSLFGGAGTDLQSGGAGNDFFIYAVNDILQTDGQETVAGDGGPGAPAGDNDTINVSAYGSLYGWKSVVIVRDSTNPSDPLYEDGVISLYNGDPAAGGQLIGTIRFTNIESFVICFTPGTLILTEKGQVAVETLVAGDQVVTRDNGVQTLRWVGHRRLSRAMLLADPDLQPVRIARGALGTEGPARSMMVSPQHRVLLGGAWAELLFGTDEVLVPAKHLIGLGEVTRALPEDGVTYIHILFDRHEIVQSDGIWTESFQPAERSLNAMEAEAREEILKLFPELATDASEYVSARLSLKAHEARVLLAD